MVQDDTNISRYFNKKSKKMVKEHDKKGIPQSMKYQIDDIMSYNVGSAFDVGSGPGTLLINLFELGLNKGYGIDLSPSMNNYATERLITSGIDKNAFEIYEGSFLELDANITPEAISLHRVICCHPDRQGMIAKSISYKPKVITLTIPRDTPLHRLFFLILKLSAKVFSRLSIYNHRIHTIQAQLLDSGYSLSTENKSFIWTTLTFIKD
ncbi:MAG: class I SAM-dependent methyltransferase [Candidatus Heimdallarchaeota archaeon]|nr:class I SAM-dependent methyltransferase [Candidatus Heimdallarchaeota archaeon]MDH5647885.1 class I SAM-dependent methyltransferase [Candidatus Heimdallarchaeota archaeon]